MAYDEKLDERIKKIVSGWKGMSSKKMFGGVCHLLNGNMVGGVYKDMLILRLGVEKAEKFLKKKHFVYFDITGRPMKGWVMAKPGAFKTDDKLRALLEQAKAFAGTLPRE